MLLNAFYYIFVAVLKNKTILQYTILLWTRLECVFLFTSKNKLTPGQWWANALTYGSKRVLRILIGDSRWIEPPQIEKHSLSWYTQRTCPKVNRKSTKASEQDAGCVFEDPPVLSSSLKSHLNDWNRMQYSHFSSFLLLKQFLHVWWAGL